MLIVKPLLRKFYLHVFLCLFAHYFVACKQEPQHVITSYKTKKVIKPKIERIVIDSFAMLYKANLRNAGFVLMSDFDTTIHVELKYATTDNFLCLNVYNGFKECYMHPKLAQKIHLAQSIIKSKNENLSIVVFDVTRPCCVQQIMWDSAKLSNYEKRMFLANPKQFSLHNFGLAIDCGLIDSSGTLVDMGTPFDFIGIKAYPCKELEMVKSGELSQKQIENRMILRNAMVRAGFQTNRYEWWHFNACSRVNAVTSYNRIVDFCTFARPDSCVYK